MNRSTGPAWQQARSQGNANGCVCSGQLPGGVTGRYWLILQVWKLARGRLCNSSSPGTATHSPVCFKKKKKALGSWMKRTMWFQPRAAGYPQLLAWLWPSCRGFCHADVAFFHSSPCTVPKVSAPGELLLILLLNLIHNSSVTAPSVCLWHTMEVCSFCSYILCENRSAKGVQ